jgi:hypothetical protein
MAISLEFPKSIHYARESLGTTRICFSSDLTIPNV